MPHDPKQFLKRLVRSMETWWFTDYELKRPENCFSKDLFVAVPEHSGENAVLVERNGTVTWLWMDGRVCTDERARARAEKCPEVAKPMYYGGNHAVNDDDVWASVRRRVYIDDDGRFESWGPETAREAIEACT